MSAIAQSVLEAHVCTTFPLAEVNPELKRRVELVGEAMKTYTNQASVASEAIFSQNAERLRQLAEEQCNIEHTVEDLTEKLNESQSILNKESTPVVVKQVIKAAQSIITINKTIKPNLVKVAQLTQTVSTIQSELAAVQVKKQTNEENLQSARVAMSGSAPLAAGGGSLLEDKVRSFDGEWIRDNVPEFNKATAINERFNSFVHDIRRPLVTFTANGKKIFNKELLKGKEDAEVMAAAAKELGALHLNNEDFFRVLEFFHQGGTAQGGVYLSKQLAGTSMSPKGVGPTASVELQIENGKLLKIVSTANYVIADVENAEEGKSFGISKLEGKKQCTTVYDFVSNEVRFNLATLALEDKEIQEIDAAGHGKKSID